MSAPGECCVWPRGGGEEVLRRACDLARAGAPRVFAEHPRGIGACVFPDHWSSRRVSTLLWLLAETPWSRADEHTALRLASIAAHERLDRGGYPRRPGELE